MAFNPIDFSIRTEDNWIEIRHMPCDRVMNRMKVHMSLAVALIMVEGHECPKTEES
jgi:hypothetical protein